MYRLNYIKFLSYSLALLFVFLHILPIFADGQLPSSHPSNSFALSHTARQLHAVGPTNPTRQSHTVREYAVNTSSPDAVWEWKKEKWILTHPWTGTDLPNTKNISCPYGHGMITARKSPGVYRGVPYPPTHIGSEGELYTAPYIFDTYYVGICEYEKKREHSATSDSFFEDVETDAAIHTHSESDVEDGTDFKTGFKVETAEETQLSGRKHPIPTLNGRIEGEWNLWKSQRFMGYEKIRIRIEAKPVPHKVEIRFSPELESMQYVNTIGHIYDYKEEIGYYVDFPIPAAPVEGSEEWEAIYILPIAKSTVDWEDGRLGKPYKVYLKSLYDHEFVTSEIDLDLTGNIHDLLYIRPLSGQ